MKKIHYKSGIILALFIAIHLINHIVALSGPEAHIALMNDLRVVYRNIIVESLVLAAVVFQIISGLKLFFSGRKSIHGFYEKLNFYTGLYMAFFLIVHVSSVLMGRVVLQLDTNFYFGVAGLNTFPNSLFFVPYYSLAIISFFGHISAVHNRKMKKRIIGLSVNRQSGIILLLGAIVAGTIIYASTNGLQGVEIPKKYRFPSPR